MVVEVAGDDLVRGLRDERAFVGRKFAEVLIDEGAGFFENAEGADEFARFGVVADVEMNEGAGGLRSVVAVGRNLDGSHAVGFLAGLHRRVTRGEGRVVLGGDVDLGAVTL